MPSLGNAPAALKIELTILHLLSSAPCSRSSSAIRIALVNSARTYAICRVNSSGAHHACCCQRQIVLYATPTDLAFTRLSRVSIGFAKSSRARTCLAFSVEDLRLVAALLPAEREETMLSEGVGKPCVFGDICLPALSLAKEKDSYGLSPNQEVFP